MIAKLAGLLTAAILSAVLAGCAGVAQPSSDGQIQAAPEHVKSAQEPANELPEGLADADGAGGAVGTLALPVGKWLGAVILQMFQNVKLSIDVKIDNTNKAVK